MKILVITTEFPNKIEKIRSVFNKELLRELKTFENIKIIAPVSLIPFFLKSNFKRIPFSEHIDDIQVFHPRYIIIPKIGIPFSGILYFAGIIKTVFKVWKFFKFDAVYGLWTYPDGLVAVLVGKIFKKPVIVHSLGCDINHYPKLKLLRPQIKFTLCNAIKVIAVSENMVQKISELGVKKDKIVRIYNGIDPQKFFPLEQTTARKKLNFPLKKKIVLFIGRLSEEKGIYCLLEAISILKKRLEDILLVIVGDGKLRNSVKKRIKALRIGSEVNIIKRIEHQDIVYMINAADLLCLPSLREGCPNILLETLACGKPIVASNVCGISELLNSDRGILVDSNKSSDLAEGLHSGLKKKWDSENKRISTPRTWKKVAWEIHNEFQSLQYLKC